MHSIKLKFRNVFAVFVVLLIISIYCISASATSPKSSDLLDVFGTGTVIGAEKDGMVPISWDNCGIGNRVTYMIPVNMDGLKIVFKNVNIGTPNPQDKGDATGLWFTFGQEAGHYWGTGSTGVHFRLDHNGTNLTLFAKKADDMDDLQSNVCFPCSDLSLKGWPATLTIIFNKIGSEYELNINGVISKIPADKIEPNISSSGKGYFTFGIYKEKGGNGSLSLAEIDNTKTDNATNSETVSSIVNSQNQSDNMSSIDQGVIEDNTDNSSILEDSSISSESTQDVDTDKNGFNWIIFVIILAVIVVGGGITVFIVLKNKKARDKTKI